MPTGQRSAWWTRCRRERRSPGRSRNTRPGVPDSYDLHRSPALSGPDLPALVEGLRHRGVNYDEAQAPPHVTAGWHQDHWAVELGHEEPGEPEPDGLFAAADALMNAYEFTDPAVLRAVYHDADRVLGRDMLLQGRFTVFRFLMGVRITAELDELRDTDDGPERVIGWAYQTLDGHLEQGRLTYEIAKNLGSGRVEFRIDAYSRQSHIRNPLYRVGFSVFGRRTQVLFYRAALDRLSARLSHPPAPPQPGPDGLVRVPSGAPPEAWSWTQVHVEHPGR